MRTYCLPQRGHLGRFNRPSQFNSTTTDVDIILSSEVTSVSPLESTTDTDGMSVDEDTTYSPYSFGEEQSADFSDDDALVDSIPPDSKWIQFSRTPSLPSTTRSQTASLDSSFSSLPTYATGLPHRSRTDKAVAALALALAHGAADLQDYQDLLVFQGPLEERRAGELWH